MVLNITSLVIQIVVNGRFCPQSVRNFCPIVAGFNAGTYKVPACVLEEFSFKYQLYSMIINKAKPVLASVYHDIGAHFVDYTWYSG